MKKSQRSVFSIVMLNLHYTDGEPVKTAGLSKRTVPFDTFNTQKSYLTIWQFLTPKDANSSFVISKK